MSLDGGKLTVGKLAAALAGFALIANATGCGGDNPPPPAKTPAPSPSTAPAPSPSAPSTTSSAPTSSEDGDDSDTSTTKSTSSSSTETSTTESSPDPSSGSSQPADITCSKFNSLGAGSQRDTLARIARANPGSALEKYPDAYLNDVRATCSQQGQESTKVLDVLTLDGTKYRAQ